MKGSGLGLVYYDEIYDTADSYFNFMVVRD